MRRHHPLFEFSAWVASRNLNDKVCWWAVVNDLVGACKATLMWLAKQIRNHWLALSLGLGLALSRGLGHGLVVPLVDGRQVPPVPHVILALLALALALDLVVVPHVLVALRAQSVVHVSTEPCAVKLLSATAAQRMAKACGRQSKWMGRWH